MDGCSDRLLSSLFYDRDSSAQEFILISIGNNESVSRFIHLRKSNIHFSEAQVFKSISVGEDFSFILSLRCALVYSRFSLFVPLLSPQFLTAELQMCGSDCQWSGQFCKPAHLVPPSCCFLSNVLCRAGLLGWRPLFSHASDHCMFYGPFLSSHTNHNQLPLYTTDSHVSSWDPCQK